MKQLGQDELLGLLPARVGMRGTAEDTMLSGHAAHLQSQQDQHPRGLSGKHTCKLTGDMPSFFPTCLKAVGKAGAAISTLLHLSVESLGRCLLPCPSLVPSSQRSWWLPAPPHCSHPPAVPLTSVTLLQQKCNSRTQRAKKPHLQSVSILTITAGLTPVG